jgi:hypothetical protein
MDLILFDNNLYHLVSVTKEMLQGIDIPKGVDCFDLCEIIRENINFKQKFMGCICGAGAPQ